jgi:hypothetical protein
MTPKRNSFPERFDAWFNSLDFWGKCAYFAFWVAVGMAVGAIISISYVN